MADKLEKVIIDALRRAAAEPAGLPLFASRREAGLFPESASGRSAAERSCAEGWLSRIESNPELWTLSASGQSQLLAAIPVDQVLEDCVRSIESRQDQLEHIRAAITRIHANLDGLRGTVERVVAPNRPNLRPAIVDVLTQWDAGEDCSLPELFGRITATIGAQPTIGEFHDALRELRNEQAIELHPWTGPLYAIPEPALAVMCGHELVYYARRKSENKSLKSEVRGQRLVG